MTMTIDITFDYPPELFNLLVDTIPLLHRSKKDVLLFLRGAGVPDSMLADLNLPLKV
jgi:restriction system protein